MGSLNRRWHYKGLHRGLSSSRNRCLSRHRRLQQAVLEAEQAQKLHQAVVGAEQGAVQMRQQGSEQAQALQQAALGG